MRLSTLRDGPQARLCADNADEWFRRQSVVKPDCVANVLVPMAGHGAGAGHEERSRTRGIEGHASRSNGSQPSGQRSIPAAIRRDSA